MHKKLAADLTSIAHSILQLKNKEDVLVLKEKAYEVYEKLTVLAYVDEYLNTTPNATETKEELLEKIENNVKEKVDAVIEKDKPEEEVVDEKEEEIKAKEIDEVKEVKPIEEEIELVVEDFSTQTEVTETNEIIEEETIVVEFDVKEELVEEIIEQPFDELKQTLFSTEKTSKDKKTITLEEELHDTISVEVAADLFEKPDFKKSLNDKLQQNIQIGLNDRIVFVKNLFNGSQEEFNRVVSQLNTLKTEKEARKFINKMVKPDYDWSKQEEFEERFMAIIERKFA